MSWCTVKDCKSGRKPKNNDNECLNVRFFRFPKNSYSSQWIDACGKNRNCINLNNVVAIFTSDVKLCIFTSCHLIGRNINTDSISDINYRN